MLPSMSERLRAHVDLALALSWRELVVRYKRSVFGVLWALIDPAFQVLVYLAVFGAVLDAGRGLESYPLFCALGVLPWLFFSMTLEQGALVLVEHYLLIRKLAFPHELLLVAVIVSRLSSLVVGAATVVVICLVGGWTGRLHPEWMGLPLMLVGGALLVAMTTGLTLVVSALQVVFADTAFFVRFGLRIGFYACPIVYPISRVPDAVRPLYDLNPLVAIIWCFQSVSGSSVPAPSPVAWASAVIGSLACLGLGWMLFRRLQGVVAELV
jgi:ABC-type polysaccharide/polyol phosphate export permease